MVRGLFNMSKVVYLLEDEDALRSTLNEFLHQNGYEVYAYSDPTFCPLSESLPCKCDNPLPCTDFIITDINMPGMSGLKFIELQKNKNCKVPNIAVMSATWSEEDYQKARDFGCKVFEKPFSFSELLKWMEICDTKSIIATCKTNVSNFQK